MLENLPEVHCEDTEPRRMPWSGELAVGGGATTTQGRKKGSQLIAAAASTRQTDSQPDCLTHNGSHIKTENHQCFKNAPNCKTPKM